MFPDAQATSNASAEASVEVAVPAAAIQILQATRLPLQLF